MGFTHYYGRHRRKNITVVHSSVVQTKTFQVRIGGELRKKIENRVKDTGKNFSELNRLLWEDYFKKYEDKLWQKECEEMFGN